MSSEQIQTSNEDVQPKERVYLKEFSRGIIKENPIFVLLLGLCPTLAVTNELSNGIAMGIAATLVLIFSNGIISLTKKFIPDKVRIPAYIIIIASFVTIIEMIFQAFFFKLSLSLGVFISLIVVNCIILGRAEAFASKNTFWKSIMDALGIGIGFTLALVMISFIRELFGKCYFDFSKFGIPLPENGKILFVNTETRSIIIGGIEIYQGALIFLLPSGAFFVLGVIIAAFNQARYKAEERNLKKEEALKAENNNR